MPTKIQKGNHCEALAINEKDDNTVKEGFISSEQLQKELEASGKATVSYIEAMKQKMNSEDTKALQEQINSEQFREQLRKATEDAKEKINTIYERQKLKTNLANIQKERERLVTEFNKNMDKYNASVKDAEIKALKTITEGNMNKTTQ